MAEASRKTEGLGIFISYSRREAAIADTFVDALASRGFDVKIDRRHLEFGEKWQSELAEFIRLSDTVLWLVSDASIKSQWVNWELDEVARRNKRLVPVMVCDTPRDKLPRQLGEIHILPIEGLFDLGRDLDTLVRVLETDRAWLKGASRLQDRATEWMAKQRASALLLRGAGLDDAERWKDCRPLKAPAPAAEILELILASRRGASVRQRRVAVVLLGVAMLSSGLAGTAWLQWRTAERNYALSIDAAEKLAIGLAQDLRGLAGVRTDKIDGLLKRAEELYATLLATAGDTDRLRKSRMWLQQEMARTYVRLGELSTARLKIEAAVSTARLQLAAAPDSRQAAEDLMQYLLDLSDIAKREGNAGNLQSALDEAVKIARKWSTPPNADRRGERNLITCLATYWKLMAPYDRERARAAVLEMAEIAERRARENPKNVDDLTTAADAVHDVASFVWGENNLVAARQGFRDATDIWRDLIVIRPTGEGSKHGLLRSLQRLADVSVLSGDYQSATEAETEALGIVRANSQRDPDSYLSQLELTFCLMRLGGDNLKLKNQRARGLY